MKMFPNNKFPFESSQEKRAEVQRFRVQGFKGSGFKGSKVQGSEVPRSLIWSFVGKYPIMEPCEDIPRG